jgi:hypothetical protein
VVFEILSKLFGAGIGYLIYLLPFTIGLSDHGMFVTARVTQPVTEKTWRLVQNGFQFSIEQTLTVIVNDSKSYTRADTHTLSWSNGWTINGDAVATEAVQKSMGESNFIFPGFHFDEGDRIVMYCVVGILPDEEFTLSTGLRTLVLWNYYTPTLKSEYRFRNGKFEMQ